MDRVKYGGSTPNPATVNVNVLSQLLEIERVVVLNSVYNAGAYGETDMQFVCDSKSRSAVPMPPPTPAIDEASAGYTLAWDMLGNGQYLAFDQWEGERRHATRSSSRACAATPPRSSAMTWACS